MIFLAFVVVYARRRRRRIVTTARSGSFETSPRFTEVIDLSDSSILTPFTLWNTKETPRADTSVGLISEQRSSIVTGTGKATAGRIELVSLPAEPPSVVANDVSVPQQRLGVSRAPTIIHETYVTC